MGEAASPPRPLCFESFDQQVSVVMELHTAVAPHKSILFEYPLRGRTESCHEENKDAGGGVGLDVHGSTPNAIIVKVDFTDE